MKVRLLARKGTNKAGTVLEFSQTTGEWLVAHGYAEEIVDPKGDGPEESSGDPGEGDTESPLTATESSGSAPEKNTPKPRRGRPRKAE